MHILFNSEAEQPHVCGEVFSVCVVVCWVLCVCVFSFFTFRCLISLEFSQLLCVVTDTSIGRSTFPLVNITKKGEIKVRFRVSMFLMVSRSPFNPADSAADCSKAVISVLYDVVKIVIRFLVHVLMLWFCFIWRGRFSCIFRSWSHCLNDSTNIVLTL